MKTKDLVTAILLIVVVIIAILALVLFTGPSQQPEPLPDAANLDATSADDSLEAINQGLNDVPEANLETEFKDVETDINSL